MAIDEVDLHTDIELLVHNLFRIETHVVIALYNSAKPCDPFAIAWLLRLTRARRVG